MVAEGEAGGSDSGEPPLYPGVVLLAPTTRAAGYVVESHYCSGLLIGPSHVLTAAHCVDNLAVAIGEGPAMRGELGASVVVHFGYHPSCLSRWCPPDPPESMPAASREVVGCAMADGWWHGMPCGLGTSAEGVQDYAFDHAVLTLATPVPPSWARLSAGARDPLRVDFHRLPTGPDGPALGDPITQVGYGFSIYFPPTPPELALDPERRRFLGYRRFRHTRVLGVDWLISAEPGGGTMYGDSGGPWLWDGAPAPPSGHAWREPPVAVTSFVTRELAPGRRAPSLLAPEVEAWLHFQVDSDGDGGLDVVCASERPLTHDRLGCQTSADCPAGATCERADYTGLRRCFREACSTTLECAVGWGCGVPDPPVAPRGEPLRHACMYLGCTADADCPPGDRCLPRGEEIARCAPVGEDFDVLALAPGDAGRTGFVDVDGDGVPAVTDSCPELYDPCQADRDHDGMGDLCDLCPGDADDGTNTDGDALPDACDVCPFLAGDSGVDGDMDGRGDDCDLCPMDFDPGPSPPNCNFDAEYATWLLACPFATSEDDPACPLRDYVLPDACDPTPCGDTAVGLDRAGPRDSGLAADIVRVHAIHGRALGERVDARTGFRFCRCPDAARGDAPGIRQLCVDTRSFPEEPTTTVGGCDPLATAGYDQRVDPEPLNWRWTTMDVLAASADTSLDSGLNVETTTRHERPRIGGPFGWDEGAASAVDDIRARFRFRDDVARWRATFGESFGLPASGEVPGVLWTHTPGGPAAGSPPADWARTLASHFFSGELRPELVVETTVGFYRVDPHDLPVEP